MKVILIIMLTMSINFLFMKHPLSMGFILLLQTIMACISCMYYSNSYMFSYILFLIFIGGMLILFMYMSSIASNEKFFFSMKLLMFNITLFISWSLISNDLMMKLFSENMKMFNSHDDCFMFKLYILPSGMMTTFVVVYLLFTLIVVVNIISLKMSPLRSSH